jgi:transcriptional regulator with XRE-family HTH domain
MPRLKTLTESLTARGLSLAQLVEASGLEDRVVQAIVLGRYTPSPDQRRRIADALGVPVEELAWGHSAEVQHVYGHGPQFGRSP